MSGNRKVNDITKATEEQIGQYFRQKGWVAQKLDEQKDNPETAADWLFSSGEICFLCEVKTITSVRKGIHKEAHFTKFAQMLHEYFSTSAWSTTPLSVSIHNDTVYQPSPDEAKKFIEWLESALLLLKDDKFIYGWARDIMPWGGKIYSTHYIFGTTSQGGEISFSVHVSTTTDSDQLELHPHIYGELHVGSVNSNIEKARNQLVKTAQRQSDTAIARVVALAFEGSSGGSIGFDWQVATKTIMELLRHYPDISAIAIMMFTSTEKYEGDDFNEWMVNALSSPIVPYFAVFHNRWLAPNIKQLDVSAFLDDYSVQVSPL